MNRHLSTLSVLHYVYGAIICFSGIAVLTLVLLGSFLQSDFLAQESSPPPDWLGPLFQTLGWVLFVVFELWGVLVIMSGNWIKKRIRRNGSTVIGGLCLLSFPLGTALGIFTLITLLNTEVQAEYNSGISAPSVL